MGGHHTTIGHEQLALLTGVHRTQAPTLGNTVHDPVPVHCTIYTYNIPTVYTQYSICTVLYNVH